ncbi:Purine efflux pump PbuE [Peribacillus sp. Bi96]|uniref:MFS transporter n=1 Tax=Peribacillus sp. Bi96 TaxID=2884273 RepID=UPI001DDEC99D|nr:MFS transporter [Peribacillus sp. Bi96]CAH0268087.1 Purine efflux pump PbuE [Peribacillus sp. Bi96]
MDKRVYLLAIVSFVVGMVELIIGGLLDIVSNDLDVSLGQVGFLMTVFSLAFALAAPILLAVTQRVERKRLTLITLFIFFIGNVIAVFSPYYSILLVGRIIAASSGSLLIALCLTMVPNIVTEQYRARAIGVVFMGVSASLVLGVPIGLMLGNAFGWRAPFIMISILTLVSMAGVFFFLERMAPKPSIPIGRQLRTLKNRKILLAQATSFVMLAGHLTLYGYLTPFLKMKLGLDGTWVSIVYLIFGIAAVVGGGIGGFLADRFGSKRTIISVIIFFAVSMLLIPYTTFSLPIFLILMVIWSMLSWAITPAMQSYLIELSPETSDIQQTLNNSAVHMGIAFGSFIGGIVIEQTSVEFNPIVGGVLVLISLGTAALSVMGYGHQEFKKS